MGGGYYNHKITSIFSENNSTVLVLKEVKNIPDDLQAAWEKDYVVQYGREPNIFDGI